MASAEILSFASLSVSGSGMNSEGGSVSVDGFEFTSEDAAFDIWEASSPNLPSLNPADTSLFEFFAGSTTTLSDGGSAFSLNSIDLAPVLAGPPLACAICGPGTFTVTFTGTHPDSSIVTQTFTVNDSGSASPALQTFTFSGFTDLVNVTFTQGTNIGFFETQDTAYQFDNAVVSTASSTIPEPGSVVLLGTGLGCLVAASIKRARA